MGICPYCEKVIPRQESVTNHVLDCARELIEKYEKALHNIVKYCPYENTDPKLLSEQKRILNEILVCPRCAKKAANPYAFSNRCDKHYSEERKIDLRIKSHREYLAEYGPKEIAKEALKK
jgi:hypothetical protein